MTINELVLKHVNLAEKLAKSKKKQLTHISYDELKSAAYLGLVQAANRFDKEKNDSFPAYATLRISGSIKDYLRELSWGSRSNPLKPTQCFLEENIVDKNVGNKIDFVSFEEMIKSLSDVNKKVLRLYYKDGKKIKEISKQMLVHESRISQILTKSKSILKDLLKNKLFDLAA